MTFARKMGLIPSWTAIASRDDNDAAARCVSAACSVFSPFSASCECDVRGLRSDIVAESVPERCSVRGLALSYIGDGVWEAKGN